jgi:hypothetical protein
VRITPQALDPAGIDEGTDVHPSALETEPHGCWHWLPIPAERDQKPVLRVLQRIEVGSCLGLRGRLERSRVSHSVEQTVLYAHDPVTRVQPTQLGERGSGTRTFPTTKAQGTAGSLGHRRRS